MSPLGRGLSFVAATAWHQAVAINGKRSLRTFKVSWQPTERRGPRSAGLAHLLAENITYNGHGERETVTVGKALKSQYFLFSALSPRTDSFHNEASGQWREH